MKEAFSQAVFIIVTDWTSLLHLKIPPTFKTSPIWVGLLFFWFFSLLLLLFLFSPVSTLRRIMGDSNTEIVPSLREFTALQDWFGILLERGMEYPQKDAIISHPQEGWGPYSDLQGWSEAADDWIFWRDNVPIWISCGRPYSQCCQQDCWLWTLLTDPWSSTTILGIQCFLQLFHSVRRSDFIPK